MLLTKKPDIISGFDKCQVCSLLHTVTHPHCKGSADNRAAEVIGRWILIIALVDFIRQIGSVECQHQIFTDIITHLEV